MCTTIWGNLGGLIWSYWNVPSQQSPGRADTSLSRVRMGISHSGRPFLPLRLPPLSRYSCPWAIWYPSKETQQPSGWCGGRNDAQIPWGCTTRIHCVARLGQLKLGETTQGVWDPGATTQTHARLERVNILYNKNTEQNPKEVTGWATHCSKSCW